MIGVGAVVATAAERVAQTRRESPQLALSDSLLSAPAPERLAASVPSLRLVQVSQGPSTASRRVGVDSRVTSHRDWVYRWR